MLKGKFVGLRSIELSDLAQMLEWRNEPQIRCYFREFRELNMSTQKIWYENITSKNSSSIMFSIVELAKDKLLGACGLCQVNWVNRSADLSVYIGRNNLYVDDRFAPDAVQILISYAFAELGLNRLWGEAYDFDDAKKNMFKKLGFTLEGKFRQALWTGNCWYDSLIYGLIRDDLHLKEGHD